MRIGCSYKKISIMKLAVYAVSGHYGIVPSTERGIVPYAAVGHVLEKFVLEKVVIQKFQNLKKKVQRISRRYD